MHNLGMIAHRMGRKDLAVDLIRRWDWNWSIWDRS
ncbi:MAG: hypothetical protein ABSB42_10940 [Tepidisphaeraceae bacterium]